MQEDERELINFLSMKTEKLNVVVMPDFFLDRLINLNLNAEQFFSKVEEVVQRKGGSIDQIAQTDQRGGNALNVTSALLSLGVNVTPIMCTSDLGFEQIRFHLSKHKVDLSHIKIFPKASVTTALEFKTSNGKANVMLRDLGSLIDFGPGNLTEEEYRLIENADYVCLLNWAGTQNHGSFLAETVFKRAKSKDKCKTYFGPADPIPNKEQAVNLLEKVLRTDKVDILSLNENEAIVFAELISSEISEFHKKFEFSELALLAARIIARNLHLRVDLHSTRFSATIKAKEVEQVVSAFNIKALRATGAGDAWDAGNLLADASGLSDQSRLKFANAVSALYLINPDSKHPTRQEVAKFLRKAELLGR